MKKILTPALPDTSFLPILLKLLCVSLPVLFSKIL